jgi:hypothetical protein
MPVEQLLEVVDVGTAERRAQAVQQTWHILHRFELRAASSLIADQKLIQL